MPVAIVIFSLCTFAFGLSEFVVAGLVVAIAQDLQSGVAAAGTAVAAYALGAAIGAPLLTARVAHWQDRRILMAAMAVLAVGSVLMSLSPSLPVLLAVRVGVGLAHGVFMAVASDAATRLVEPARAGRALSVVWLGLTLALALGVPAGTLLGSLWSWRAIFLMIGALAVLGLVGLCATMPRANDPARTGSRPAVSSRLRAIAHPVLLHTAALGVLTSMAVFAFFTYVSPFVLEEAGGDTTWLSTGMLLFGVCTIAGNLLGGWLADTKHASRSTLVALALLAAILVGLYGARHDVLIVVMLIGVLGAAFFAIVTLLTLRLLTQAQRHAPQASAVAAGVNIAAFNLGTALGGALGSLTMAYVSLAAIPLVGALIAGLAVIVLAQQRRTIHAP